MGAQTPIDHVWYPDTTDSQQANVWASTMASSVENGIGARLRTQEAIIGLKAGLPASTALTATAALLPFSAGTVDGQFNQGLTFSGGTITITQAGVYFVSVSLGANNVASKSLYVDIRKNASILGNSEVATQASWYINSAVSLLVNCAANDTISCYGNYTPTGDNLSSRTTTTFLSVGLIRPVAPAV